MNENNIITINNTSYNIEEKWLEIAKKYFNVNNDDEVNISLLKTGLFGYNNEIMSNEVKSAIYHRNLLYYEHFLNTASIPTSIYNFAKIQNLEVDNATPAHMLINFSFRKSNIMNSSYFHKLEGSGISDSDSAYEFIISNEFIFNLGEYQFRLPYPIQLLFKKNNIDENFTVTARYIYENNRFPFKDINDPYIKLWEENYQSDKLVFLALDIYQLEKSSNTVTITTEDISENLFYDFDYSGQLAYFNVYYTYNEERELINSYFNNTFTPPENEKYCYYTHIDDNKIELSFSSLPNNFRPRLNSTIQLDIYTTNGSKANFSYNGNIIVNYLDDNSMSKIPVYITPITDSNGGQDKPDYLTIKNILMKNYLLRDNLIMESDLDDYFNRIATKNTIYNSKIKFIKKRNDIIKRMFSAYILLRNNEGNVLPTTTIPSVLFSVSQLRETNNTITEKVNIVYDIENDVYTPIFHILQLKDYLNKPTKYLIYSIPYLIKIEDNPILASMYYKTYINENINLKYISINTGIPYKFLITNCSIKKNTIDENTYTIQLTINSNLIDPNFNDNVKVRGILYSYTNNEVYGYFEFNRIESSDLIYEAYLSADRNNPIRNNMMNLYNSLYDLETTPTLNTDGFTSVKNCYINGSIKLEIQVLYKNKYNVNKYGNANKMPDMGEFGTACTVISENNIELFKNMSNMIESNVISSPMGMTLKQIPVIEYNYFNHNYETLFNLLNNYIQIFSINMDKLENNTNIDMKFYNTYGRSYQYNYAKEKSSLDGSYDYSYLDRIDININLNIAINGTVTPEFDFAIKKFISDFVESCNDDGIFPISNLIRKLEMEFEDIRYIEFNKINENESQKLIAKYASFKDMNQQEIADYVPEYLNIRKQLVLVHNENSVEQYYNYAINVKYIE